MQSDQHTAGYLLCKAAKRNDLTVMSELLKQGLNIESKDHQGCTAMQVALQENHGDMIQLLYMNGSDVAAALNNHMKEGYTTIFGDHIIIIIGKLLQELAYLEVILY